MLSGLELWAVAEEALRSRLWDGAMRRHDARLARPKAALRRGAALPGLEAKGRVPFEAWMAEEGEGVRAATRVQGTTTPAGAVAVVPIYGPLTQHASWYLCSTDEIQAAVAAALGMPEISAVVLRFHSPGGSQYGIQTLADYLRGVRGGPKPVVGHADSVACSAAYWALASCTEAWATAGGDVASIGAYIEHVSSVGLDKALGLKRTMIRMPEGKMLGWEGEELSDEARAHYLARVTSLYNAFVAGVAKARGVSVDAVRSEDWGRGRIVQAEAAAKLGMIDGVRPFAETVQAAARLARRQSAGSGGARAEAPAAAEPEASALPAAAGEMDPQLAEELLRLEAGA